MIYNGYDSDYDTRLKISGTCTMQIRRIKQLAIEIFKTANNLNPEVTILQHTVIKVQKSEVQKYGMPCLLK